MRNPWVIKINRAHELIRELEKELEFYFLNTPPITEIRRGELSNTFSVILVELAPIPDIWSAVVGDVVHNLRSALDSIMFSIISHRAAQVNREIIESQIYFPIVVSPEELRATDHKKSKWHQKLGDEDLFQVLDEFMPYYGDLRPELSDQEIANAIRYSSIKVLQKLSNDDKHRTINVLMCGTELLSFGLPPGAEVAESRLQPNPIQIGELFRVKITGLAPDVIPDFRADFKVGLEFDTHPASFLGVSQRLQGLLGQVTYWTNRLEYFTSGSVI